MIRHYHASFKIPEFHKPEKVESKALAYSKIFGTIFKMYRPSMLWAYHFKMRKNTSNHVSHCVITLFLPDGRGRSATGHR
jgi:hypothetical protein